MKILAFVFTLSFELQNHRICKKKRTDRRNDRRTDPAFFRHLQYNQTIIFWAPVYTKWVKIATHVCGNPCTAQSTPSTYCTKNVMYYGFAHEWPNEHPLQERSIQCLSYVRWWVKQWAIHIWNLFWRRVISSCQG